MEQQPGNVSQVALKRDAVRDQGLRYGAGTVIIVHMVFVKPVPSPHHKPVAGFQRQALVKAVGVRQNCRSRRARYDVFEFPLAPVAPPEVTVRPLIEVHLRQVSEQGQEPKIVVIAMVLLGSLTLPYLTDPAKRPPGVQRVEGRQATEVRRRQVQMVRVQCRLQ